MKRPEKNFYRIAVTCFAIVLVVLTSISCGRQNLRSEPRNEDLASRRVRLICPDKPKLAKNDLEGIAKKYDVALEDILKLNESCRAKDVTEINLETENCQKLKEPACGKWTLILPLH